MIAGPTALGGVNTACAVAVIKGCACGYAFFVVYEPAIAFAVMNFLMHNAHQVLQCD
jgi:hypothetical protein